MLLSLIQEKGIADPGWPRVAMETAIQTCLGHGLLPLRASRLSVATLVSNTRIASILVTVCQSFVNYAISNVYNFIHMATPNGSWITGFCDNFLGVGRAIKITVTFIEKEEVRKICKLFCFYIFIHYSKYLVCMVTWKKATEMSSLSST